MRTQLRPFTLDYSRLTYTFKIGIILLSILFTACGGEEVVEDEGEYEPNDSIIEYDIDEGRTSAVEFNNELSLMQEDMLNMIETLFMSDSSNADINYSNAVFEAEMNLAELKEMEFDGSEDDFIAAMLQLMNFYLDELKNGFKEILPILKKEELSEDEKEQMRKYDNQFVQQEKDYFMEVFEAQDAFAEKHNISLLEQ